MEQASTQTQSTKKTNPIPRIIIIVLVLGIGGYFGYQKIHFALTHETMHKLKHK
jgi:flagellar biosynthesis protein FliQ